MGFRSRSRAVGVGVGAAIGVGGVGGSPGVAIGPNRAQARPGPRPSTRAAGRRAWRAGWWPRRRCGTDGRREREHPPPFPSSSSPLTCWLSISSGFSMWRVVARRATSHSASPKAALWNLGPLSLNASARSSSAILSKRGGEWFRWFGFVRGCVSLCRSGAKARCDRGGAPRHAHTAPRFVCVCLCEERESESASGARRERRRRRRRGAASSRLGEEGPSLFLDRFSHSHHHAYSCQWRPFTHHRHQ